MQTKLPLDSADEESVLSELVREAGDPHVEMSPMQIASIEQAILAGLQPHRQLEKFSSSYRRSRTKQLLALAAGIGLVVVAGALALAVKPNAWVFGQVIENIKKTNSVSFTAIEYFDPAPNRPEMERSKWELQGTLIREEKLANQQGDRKSDLPPALIRVRIVDVGNKSLLEINYPMKRVRKVQLTEAKAELFRTFIDAVSTLSANDAEPEGDEQLNGIKTKVYRLKRLNPPLGDGKELEERNPAKVWVDAKSGLPVQIVIERPISNASKIVLDKFLWNEPIDPNVFKPEIPEGFRIVEEQAAPRRRN